MQRSANSGFDCQEKILRSSYADGYFLLMTTKFGVSQYNKTKTSNSFLRTLILELIERSSKYEPEQRENFRIGQKQKGRRDHALFADVTVEFSLNAY